AHAPKSLDDLHLFRSSRFLPKASGDDLDHQRNVKGFIYAGGQPLEALMNGKFFRLFHDLEKAGLEPDDDVTWPRLGRGRTGQNRQTNE
ncbi:MAG: hypothetical protein MK294_05650, partial [Rhodospirillales bacterium]|nr:hypothetical protein [Rhodospirillales bacterium]